MRKTKSRSGVEVAISSTVECPTSRYRRRHHNVAVCDQNKLRGHTKKETGETDREGWAGAKQGSEEEETKTAS